jgi:hypothetical protein
MWTIDVICRMTDRKWNEITAECVKSASQPISKYVWYSKVEGTGRPYMGKY